MLEHQCYLTNNNYEGIEMADANTTSKVCKKCGILKILDLFFDSPSNRDRKYSKCKICVSEQSKEYRSQWQRDNRERCAEKSRRYRINNPEKVRESKEKLKDWQNDYRKKWRAEKKKIGVDVDLKWKLENKEKLKEYKKKYNDNNPQKNAELNAKRRASKKNATPGWADREAIKKIYELAKEKTEMYGVKMVVDHIIPLQSKLACGFHCEDNLQIITVSENCKKSNKHWPDMP